MTFSGNLGSSEFIKQIRNEQKIIHNKLPEMKENINTPRGEDGMDERLWEYIDGLSSAEERSSIEKMLETNRQWKQKYHELLEVHRLMKTSALEEPSLRFTKNVMEEIAKFQIAPATKTYINKRVIWGIGTFFIVLILGFLVYGFGQVNWTAKSGAKLPVDFSQVDFSKFFNNTYVNVFMMINVVLGLMLLDRFLASKRKNIHKEA
jgi:magnesium-transporting ATPase (P-type)